MERLQQRIEQAEKALGKLAEVLSFPETEIHRDAAIQRFEFTTEATWKLAQLFLRQEHGIESGSPKSVMRSCFEVALLNEKEASQAIELLDDRNLTVHTYNEGLAETIYKKLNNYHALLKKLVVKIKKT